MLIQMADRRQAIHGASVGDPHRKILYRSVRKRIEVALEGKNSLPLICPRPVCISGGEAGSGTYPAARREAACRGCQGIDGPEPSTLLDEQSQRCGANARRQAIETCGAAQEAGPEARLVSC